MSRWIRPKNRLPKEGAVVLMAYQQRSGDEVEMALGEYTDPGIDASELDGWSFVDDCPCGSGAAPTWPCTILAWTPLPRPPQKEGFNQCPHCKEQVSMFVPTEQQIKAYALVELKGLTTKEAAVRMGTSRQAVEKLIVKFRVFLN